MARGAGGVIPGNRIGQGFTGSSTLTHLLGVSGAPTGTVGGAAVGSGSMRSMSPCTAVRVGHAVFCGGGTQQHPLSAATAKNRVLNANCGTGRRHLHAPTANGSTADGTRRSTGDTQKMGESAGTGEALA